MTDTIFKNPYRGRKVAKAAPYEPEHERLGVNPIEYPVNKEEVVSVQKKAIQSGIHEETLWNKTATPGDLTIKGTNPPATVVISEDENNKTVSRRHITEPICSRCKLPIANCTCDGDIATVEEESFSFSRVVEGQFILSYNDNILCIGDKDTVEEYLTEYLTNNDVDISELIILKKVGIKVGAFINV